MSYWLVINYIMQVVSLLMPLLFLLDAPNKPDHAISRVDILNPDHLKQEKHTLAEQEAERKFIEEYYAIRFWILTVECSFLLY